MDISRWGFGVNSQGHLVIGGCSAVDLVKQYGTPLHVIDRNRLIGNYTTFSNAFNCNGIGTETFYSYKTNCLPGMLKILHDQGAGAEVISGHELRLAVKLGVPPGRIVYNGPNKSLESLRLAVSRQIRLINIDSFNEIDKISSIAQELKTRVDVGIRITPPAGWSGQFGFEIPGNVAFDACARISRSPNLFLKGLHAHIGTGIAGPEPYVRTLREMLGLSKVLKERLDIDIRYIDIGGGFPCSTVKTFSRIGGIAYSFFNNIPDFLLKGTPPIEVFASRIMGAAGEICKDLGIAEPVIFLEPGRAITSSPQVLLLTIGVIKKRKHPAEIAITDGGSMTIARPVTYEYHEAFIANKMNKEKTKSIYIAGNLCTPADIVYRNKRLPEVSENDILAIMDSGAYFMSLSNNFSFPRPPIVLAHDGRSEILSQRETFEQMTARDGL